ncbi:MAG: eCIS core domain-containing protein [Ferruginibacter sp.]
MDKISVISNHYYNPLRSENNSSLFFSPIIQPKLTINNPGDKYEQEADAMADKVMRMEQPGIRLKSIATDFVQRKCVHCEEKDKKLQRKEINNKEPSADSNLERYIGNLSSGGKPLPGEVRDFYEPRFGYDFGNVRVHTDAGAAKSAKSIHALAYTAGNSIVFNNEQFSPNTDSGKKLLGHELTHVIQQAAGSTHPAIQRSVTITSPYPVSEDFDPGVQFIKKDKALGRSEPVLNNQSQTPGLNAKKFERSLQLPILSEKNLDEISRPDLSDSSLDPVRNNLIELKIGSAGKRVQLIQEALIAWGKGLAEPVEMLPKYGADQIYGNETKGAVDFFQDNHPLLQKDGVVGDLTLAELENEMDKLHGIIFTLQAAGSNNYSGLIHIPPPSKNWQRIAVTADEFFDNPTIDTFNKSEVAGKCAASKKFNLFFAERESIIPSLLKHERIHEKDQLKIITDHLIEWDKRLEIAALLKMKFKAAHKNEAMKMVFVKSGADSPDVLSKKIIGAMIESNKKLHSGPENVVPVSHLDIIDCNNFKFSYTVTQ